MWPPSWTWIKKEREEGMNTTLPDSQYGKTKSPLYKSGNRLREASVSLKVTQAASKGGARIQSQDQLTSESQQ